MSLLRFYQQLKNIYHLLQAHWWRFWYGLPERGLILYGITGTNGKTTTSYILGSILAAHYGEEKVGMLTTVAFRIGEQEVFNETKMTTLPSKLVFSYLKQMKEAGVSHAVLEMTSHALDQNRLAGIRLSGAIILNIEREHLDYHQTMEEYATAKMRIVRYLKPDSPLVYKSDDERVRGGVESLQPTTYPADRRDPAKGGGNLQPVPFTSQQAKAVESPLEGEVNKENVLAARLLAQALGIPQSAIDAGVAAVTHVPGRMEWVDLEARSTPLRQGFAGQGKQEARDAGPRILIDYAVTPEALERLYQYVRSTTNGRILALLGAAGLRDRGKRPDMARTVAKHADLLVLTREDPWTEPEEQIFSDLEQGLTDTQIEWRKIVDRREALRYLLQQARAGDVIVVTGKGAERGMGIGKNVISWNDREVIIQLLSELKS